MNVASYRTGNAKNLIATWIYLIKRFCLYAVITVKYGMSLFSALNAHPMIYYLPTLALATYQRSNTIQ